MRDELLEHPDALAASADLDHGLAGRLLSRLESRRAEILEAILDLVRLESPSHHKPSLDHLADHLAARYAAAGARVERIANPADGDHLRVTWDEARRADAAPILVLAHFDTVWPLGTIASMPIRVEDGRAHGPGVYDMKAAFLLVESAIDALRAAGVLPARPVVLLATSDEEIGSRTSRPLIEAEARRAACALVLEPPLPGGRLKTARKGVGQYTLRTRGVPAHAGVEPDRGASAVVELAHQILDMQKLARPEVGTTLNVGRISGGTALNVIPAEAVADLDVRVATLDEADRIDAALRTLRPAGRRTALEIEGGLNRPPMVRNPATVALFQTARRLGTTLGLDLGEGSTGGGSDGNFTSAVGCPTLDGLGCEGDGAHAHHEHILVDAIPRHAALLALLLAHEPGHFRR
jgi:glutamate carboxypeptidase